MRGFMDFAQDAFLAASDWNVDNSYGNLTATSRALLDFDTPSGIRLHVSSLTSPHLASSYTLSSVGVVDGSFSYLYSSLPLPLKAKAKTATVPLRTTVPGYRQLQDLRNPDLNWWWEVWRGGKRIDRRDVLMYGRMFMPSSTLEALYFRRLAPTKQLKINAVSSQRLKNGGTILAVLQQDTGKYSTEFLYSTDSSLAGVRGLYNIGPDPRKRSELAQSTKGSEQGESPSFQGPERYGRLSLGGELYYGLLNKSGGISTGLRFTTLTGHQGFPLTMTATLNPLMGNLSASYAVKAGEDLSMAARFDFNVFSYESGVVLGCELWKRHAPSHTPDRLEMLPGVDNVAVVPRNSTGSDIRRPVNDDTQGVLKARIDQKGDIGILWEGRVKDLLFSLGTSIDLRSRLQPIRSFGVEFQYAS